MPRPADAPEDEEREGPGADLDERFTLANERTFLAWNRTALALIGGGLAAGQLLDFESRTARMNVVAPGRRSRNCAMNVSPLRLSRSMSTIASA